MVEEAGRTQEMLLGTWGHPGGEDTDASTQGSILGLGSRMWVVVGPGLGQVPLSPPHVRDKALTSSRHSPRTPSGPHISKII